MSKKRKKIKDFSKFLKMFLMHSSFKCNTVDRFVMYPLHNKILNIVKILLDVLWQKCNF